MTAVAPRATAMLTATVMPRSLNDPVGLAPSTFRYTSHPVRADNTGAGSRGVAPSPRVITGAPSGTASRSRYWLITPGQLTLVARLARLSGPGGPARARVGGLTPPPPPPRASRWRPRAPRPWRRGRPRSWRARRPGPNG